MPLPAAREARTASSRFPAPRIAHELAALNAIRYRFRGRAIVQRTKIPDSLGEILKNLGISTPKKIMSVAEPASDPAPA
jgi:hypothetical protein